MAKRKNNLGLRLITNYECKIAKDKDKYEWKTNYFYSHDDGSNKLRKVRMALKEGELPDDDNPPKWMYWEHYNEATNSWVPGMGGHEPSLYEHKRLRPHSGMPVILFEGEKDCETLHREEHSIIATTAPWSSGWKPEWSELLKDRDVIICPDHDEHGLKYCERAAKALLGIAKSVRLITLPRLEEGEDFTDWMEQRDGSIETFRWLMERAQPWRPTIRCTAGNVPAQADEGQEALQLSGADIFDYGSQLVRPVIEQVDGSDGSKVKVARFRAFNETSMNESLSLAAKWERYKDSQGKWGAIDPPRAVAQTILERVGRWPFPKVSGIITCPTLRPDGTVLREPGFDEATQLVLVTQPGLEVSLPSAPTREDAEAALKLLDALLTQFPFVDEASHSVALSALITPVVRGAMVLVPLHAATAPTAGTGKSFLFDLATAIATGRRCPVLAAGETREELEKRLGAAMLKGQPILSIDNVNGILGGELLCQIHTQPNLELRILGRSENVSIEHRVTMFANGNNLELKGDLVRRAIRCQLDAKVERPELRRFKEQPISDVMSNRGTYIAAALTVVRAYIVAGRPGQAELPPLASFSEWSKTVRGALVWLGRVDPVATIDSAREDDTALMAAGHVFEAMAMAQTFDLTHALTSGEWVKAAIDRTPVEIGEGGIPQPGPFVRPDLQEALLQAAPDRRNPMRIDPLMLGRWLLRHHGRVVGDYRLERERDLKHKQWRWKVARVGSPTDA